MEQALRSSCQGFVSHNNQVVKIKLKVRSGILVGIWRHADLKEQAHPANTQSNAVNPKKWMFFTSRRLRP